MGNLCGRMKTVDEFILGTEEGGKEIIKNKLMRGINYSINASVVSLRTEFRGRDEEMRKTDREKCQAGRTNRGENRRGEKGR